MKKTLRGVVEWLKASPGERGLQPAEALVVIVIGTAIAVTPILIISLVMR